MRKPKSSGLILLVVLGMLTLFSMLAISYVVFSGQSRSANLAMVRKDFRGTPAPKLLDQAVQIALRGTTDPSSALLHHDLLGDVYGQAEQPIFLRPRLVQAANTGSSLAGTPEQPSLTAGTFVRIPIANANATTAAQLLVNIPTYNDVWTGRVLTFQAGPLRNHSFRIVRSIGDTRSSTNVNERPLAFSVVIDLSSIGNNIAAATVQRSAAASAFPYSQSISDWINNDFFNLFYQDANAPYTAGWNMMINATPFNAHSTGVTAAGLTQTVRLNAPIDNPTAMPGTARGEFPISLQPNLAAIPHQAIQPANSVSDSDEGYDAPDYANFYLYHRFADGTDQWPPAQSWEASDYIIPSFHRAALINYVVNESDPATYTLPDLLAVLQRIQAMTGRPLSYVVRPDNNPNNPPFAAVNTNFTGSNRGLYPGPGNFRIPQLNVIYDGNWAASGLPVFLDWVRQLTRGPWDVDNDDDGVNDSIWADPNLPLVTSPEGKLLKILVAYQIEDLDGRLDMNAVGDLAHSNTTYTYASQSSAVYGDFDTATNTGHYLTQGFGYGPAETSLRHLFAAGAAGNAAHQNFMLARQRYASATGASLADVPGREGDDLYSILGMRESPIWYTVSPSPTVFTATSLNHRWRYRHETLPGLPLATRGRQGLGIDLHGNPLLLNGADGLTNPPLIGNPPFDEGFNDPYERRFASGDPADSPFTFADWERFERRYDLDHSSMSRRLEEFAAPNPNVARLLTPSSRHLRHTPMAGNRVVGNSSSSFIDMMRAIAAIRPGTPANLALTDQMLAELFPFEFDRAEGLNLNRALGNGIDDDNDGQFDEPQELAALQRSVIVDGATVTVSNPPVPSQTLYDLNLQPSASFDPALTNADQAAFGGSQSRQLLARHLYCLAMFVLPDPFTPSNRNSITVTGADRARMLAQWAVNVVDFRDADAVMTRFPYDPDPFNANGAVKTSAWYLDPTNLQVVWGMEQPELVMTESLATHDLKVRDTTAESSSGRNLAGGDPDYDQLRLPEGAAFLELRALRTTGTTDDQTLPGVPYSPSNVYPNSLYTNVPGINPSVAGLNLAAISPIVNINGTSVAYPVWRIAISQPHSVAAGTSTFNNTPFQLSSDQSLRSQVSYQFPNIVSGGSASPNGLIWDRSGTVPTPLIDRVIWFAGNVVPNQYNLPDVILPPVDGADDVEEARSRVFANLFNDPVVLQGGQHLVIGPKAITYFGSKTAAGADPMLPVNLPNDHRIVLQNQIQVADNTLEALDNWATVYEGNGTRVHRRAALTTTNVGSGPMSQGGPSRTLTMRAVAEPQWDPSVMPTNGNLPTTIGFNVSAPHPTLAEFYKTPTDKLNSTDSGTDPTNGARGFELQDIDAYHDFGDPASVNFLEDTPFDGRNELTASNVPRYPLGALLGPSNEPAWQPGLDKGIPRPGTMENWCTAYLQRLADPERPWHATFNPYITVDWLPIDLTVFSGEETIAGSTYKFASRQKTGVPMNVDLAAPPVGVTTSGQTFLSTASETIRNNSMAASNPNAYFDVELPMDLASSTTPPFFPLTPRPTNPWDQTNPTEHFTTLGYINSTFRLRGEADRLGITTPFVTNFEGAAWSSNGASITTPASVLWLNRQFANVYELALVPVSSPGQFMQEFSLPTGTATNYYTANQRLPYSYLMNWFQQPTAAANVPPGSPPFVAPAAIFEMVSTPSPWADANEYLPAAVVANNPTLATLHAPHNRVSRFVEPGRVNLNTISDPRVWQGLMWNLNTAFVTRDATMPTPPFWDPSGLRDSRRGYTLANGPFLPNPNPFLHADYPTQFAGVFKSSFEAGFVPRLRGGVQLDAASTAMPVNTTIARMGSNGTPLFALTTPTAGIPRNPFEDFQYFTRLANLTTTRSNVFSMRVTVGYFEYDAGSGLGPEYGEDQGTSRRHRGFYIIDRSIPVGYQEGQDLNTDNCIRLRRILE